jgi:hypothetical protein
VPRLVVTRVWPLGSALGGAAAVITRLVRYRGARRRQVVWFLAGALPMLVGLFTDPGASVIAQTVSAAVIFGGLIGGMAWALLGGPAHGVDLERPPTVVRR